MTTTSARAPARWSLDDDARQLIAVLVMAAVALTLGLGLLAWTRGETRSVEQQGVSAAIPAGWVSRQGVGDVVLVAFDPTRPSLRYSVSRPSLAPGGTPSQAADLRIAARAAVLPAFGVLDRRAASVNGQPAEEITFTYADARPGLPVVSVEGRDLILTAGAASPLVVTLESPSDAFDAALPDFERFAASVKE